MFLAIREILRDDACILGTTNVGVIPNFEKDTIVYSDSFYETMMLANVITYAITQTENDKLKPAIHEIDKHFVDGFAHSSEHVVWAVIVFTFTCYYLMMLHMRRLV